MVPCRMQVVADLGRWTFLLDCPRPFFLPRRLSLRPWWQSEELARTACPCSPTTTAAARLVARFVGVRTETVKRRSKRQFVRGLLLRQVLRRHPSRQLCLEHLRRLGLMSGARMGPSLEILFLAGWVALVSG